MKISKIIISVLMVSALGAVMYFREDIIKFYDSFSKATQSSHKGVQNFQKTDVGSTLPQVSKEMSTPPPLSVKGTGEQAVLSQSKIVIETNIQRQQNGNLPALVENAKLDEAAAAKANDMFLNQYFEHISPTGVDPGKLVQSYGYDYIVAGENLILGNFSSETEVVQYWMNSPPHRANILDNRYTEIGTAVVEGIFKGQKVSIGVQEFGLPMSACIEPSVALKNQIESYKTQLDNLSSQIYEKKNQINKTNPISINYNQLVDDYNQLVKDYNPLAAQVKDIIITYNKQVSIFNNCVTGK